MRVPQLPLAKKFQGVFNGLRFTSIFTATCVLHHWLCSPAEFELQVDEENKLALGTSCHLFGSFNYFSLWDLRNQKSIIDSKI